MTRAPAGTVEQRPTDPPARLLTPAFAVLWVASLCVFLSFYLLLPVLPVYAAGLGMGESAIGLVIGVFALASMVWKPWTGWVLDWHGRRTLLIAGAALFALASLCYPVTGSVWSLLMIRVVHGTGMGFFPTAATAIATDLVPAARRGEAMGLFGMAANLALATGPALAGPASARLGFTGVCVLATGLATAGTALALLTRETGVRAVRPPFRLRGLLARQALYPAMLTLLVFVPYGTLMAFLPLLARERAVANPGLFFTLIAVALLLIRTPAGQLSDRFGRPVVVAPALATVAAALLVVALSRTSWAVYGAGLLFGLGFGGAQPALMAWATDLVPPGDRGRAMATYYTAWELGIGGGQIFLGLLIPLVGFAGLFAVAAAIPFTGAALALGRFALQAHVRPARSDDGGGSAGDRA
jgi:MFS family permease